jgi:dTDP-4-dehydrorhamnose reductase
MRILVTGAKGMLGRDLVKILSGRFDVAGIDIEEADITRVEGIRLAVRDRDPEFIVHAAAYTDVDGCETDSDAAFRVNAIGTRNVARCAAERDIPILYISTDFVFNGEKSTPYREYDPTGPINEYGYSKQAGEEFVRFLHDKFYIVRTAWLFGRHGRNFVDTILRGFPRNGVMRVVNDQVGSPTYTRDLSETIAELISRGAGYGIYHITNGGSCSWYDFAARILDIADRRDVTLEAISTVESGRVALRPANSVLENRALRIEGIKPLRPWEEALADYLRNFDRSGDA